MTQVTESCALEVCNVSFMRNENIIFNNINFKLGDGDLFQINGANGSGKSTLLRVLAGLLTPTEGDIHWHGENASHHRSDYQKDLFYLGHKNAIKDDLSPVENLEYVRLLKDKQTGVSCIEALQAFHLEKYRDYPVVKLSAGQKRKVALARLLIMETSTWLLDEPFTALDQAGKAILEDIIKTHIHNGGMVVFATHQAMEIQGCSVQHYHMD